ncbi:MAG TPA: FliM/FliN family flagellar motor switch protein [Terriglobales bacterium]|nr:FliM/FliN family flagellar motor switch protein [Terriglobales bacterium]
MEKVLNQEEIDAVFRAARGAASDGGSSNERKTTPCNFRQAGQIGSDQVRSISALHEGFARNLTHWLAAYLRTSFECNLVSVEQISYREVLSRIPELAYVASFCLNPGGSIGALQLDLSIAFPIIDVLLGGQGSGESQLREATEIEDGILEGVVRIICRELQTAWQPLGLEFVFDQRQQPSQMQRVMAPSELTLCLSFELRMPEARGTLNLIFPSVVATALLRKLSLDWAYQKPQASAEISKQLRQRLLGCSFVVELGLPEVRLRVSDVVRLRPGDLLPLRRSVNSPINLVVGDQRLFTAAAVRKGNARAAQVKSRIELRSTVGGK